MKRLYIYRCPECSLTTEVYHSIKDCDSFEIKCPNCKSFSMKRLLSAPPVHYKGSGFYTTDYTQKDAH